MTKGQEEFVDQLTRKLLVDWCDLSLRNAGGGTIAIPEAQMVYRDHALSKKWLSAKGSPGSDEVIGAGWETAAKFLKR